MTGPTKTLQVDGSVGLTTSATDGTKRFHTYPDDYHSWYYKSSVVNSQSADVMTYYQQFLIRHQDSTNVFIIRGNGNVGIGTDTPAGKLHVVSAVPECAIFDTSSSSYGAMNVFKAQGVTKGNAGYNAGSMYFGGEAGTNTIIQSGGQTGIYINNSTQNVGIGTTSPSKKLEVAGSYKLGTNAYIQYDAGYPYTINMLNTAAVGNLILNAGAGSSGYESKIELQGSNTAGAAGITLSAGSTTRMRITSDGGTFLYPSTGTYGLSMNDTNQVMNSGYVNGNQTVSLTYTCTSMSSMFIQCVFNHYGYVTSYGCARVATFAVGPVITIQNILEVTSPNGGSWTFNRVSSTEFTVVKTAGTYPGGGRWFVKINGARVFAA